MTVLSSIFSLRFPRFAPALEKTVNAPEMLFWERLRCAFGVPFPNLLNSYAESRFLAEYGLIDRIQIAERSGLAGLVSLKYWSYWLPGTVLHEV